MALVFAWDLRKKSSNLSKHGVSFQEAVEAAHDPLLMTALDERHAVEEKRSSL